VKKAKDNAPTGHTADPARRRGRPLRTQTRGFGAFLEAVMRLQHAVQASHLGFTDYIGRLYAEAHKKPGISLRHLMRLRGAQDIPSFGTLGRISEGFPAFGEYEENQPGQRRFKEELWTPRLGWSAIRQFWQLLPHGSEICLCMGLVPSWALERITGPLANDIGLAIVDTRRDLRFHLIFPQATYRGRSIQASTETELSGEQILEDLQLSIMRAMLRSGRDTAGVRSRIRTQVLAWEMAPSLEALHFWSRCPRALMISNLFRKEHQRTDFAAAYEVNQVPFPATFIEAFDPPLPQPLTSAGWGFLLPQSHDRIRELFHQVLATGKTLQQCT
jgi:hypothetical protein